MPIPQELNNPSFPEVNNAEGILDYYFEREGTYRELSMVFNTIGGQGEMRATIQPDASVLIQHRWEDGKKLNIELSRDTAHFAYLSTTCGGDREHALGHPTYTGLVDKLIPVLVRIGIVRLTAVTQDDASTMVLQRHGGFEWANGVLVWRIT